MPEQAVDLSVVIATTAAWPELKMTLDSLQEQIQECRAELILLDGHGDGLPPDLAARFPGAVAIVKPGASVFTLRSVGLSKARGAIVAVTEDHCRLGPDWCSRLLESHRRYPDAAAVGGAVENGSTESVMDWANFFVAHSPLMPPIPSGESPSISLQAGMALKRWAIPAESPAHGLMEMLYVPELRRGGKKLIADGGMVVEHVQSHGFWRTFAVHFHNGRSIAGFRRYKSSLPRIAAGLLTRPAVPFVLVARPIAAVFRTGRFARKLALALPLIAALSLCHTAGEIAGYCFGPGSSPRKLS